MKTLEDGTNGGGPVEQLRDVVAQAAGSVRGSAAEAPAASLARRPRADFGDYSTNVALLLAPALKAPPRQIAEAVGESLSAGLGEVLERVEVAGPGFLNVFLADSWFRGALAQVREAGVRFGAGAVPAEQRERILVEFDRFFFERTIHDKDRLRAAIEALGSEQLYESEGATWLRTSRFGDDKDRVLLRSSGEPTYFAADIAYHQDKRGRGYD